MELAFNFGGQEVKPPPGIPTGDLSYLQKLLSNFLTIFIIAGAFLLVIYIVWGGIQWITSGGDKQKLSTARGRIVWASIGFIMLMIAVFIINAVGYFFRVNLLKLG
jgi:hypothetical protein